MSQWGQPGFQYPIQTGFPSGQPQQHFQPGQQLNPAPQFQQHQAGFIPQPGAPTLGTGFGGLAPQPTGFPGARPQGLQQPQQTGFPGAPTLLQAQPTGFLSVQPSFQQRPPPVPPLPASYQHNPPPPPPSVPQHPTSFLNVNQSRLGGPSVSSFAASSLVAQPIGVGLLPQPTGFAGRAPAPLVPQVTGFVDPRLQMMSSSFMPANVSAPYTSGGAPQLAPPPQQQLGGLSLQQSFQQHNQASGRGTTPKIPWALSKGEKKQYDQIFRAWDTQGTGFINGQTALEVFGQSGLDRNDLARIWTLADADNRGKLNLAEFHVAMGLIYRRLNGNDIPDELPSELVPPSSRDLDTSVNFLKDILKNDTRSRSPSGLDTPVSRLKERSFTSSSSFTQQGGRQDATVYKHEDVEPPGGFYQPRNRHVDRSTIRSRADDVSPAATDLSSIKRQLLNTQKMLDDTLANERSSDALDRELEDLRYRITRLQEDLEYVSKGPRTTAKDEERRRLERELVRLMHEEVPELEKKVEEREGRREREKREWVRDRDRRNDRYGRYGDESSERYSPTSRYREEEERPYSRTASKFDPDRPSRDEDRDRVRDDDGDRDRGLPTATRMPPPPPPPPPASSTSLPALTPPAPARSPAPATKNMTPEQRQAFIRAEAQRRLEARKQALGVIAPPSAPVASPTLDTTIEDRLAQEKKEAEEKTREAERQTEEREKQRKEKLEAEKALRGAKAPTPTPTTTAPPPAPTPVPVPTSTVKIPPPTPKPRGPAPPPPRRGTAARAPSTSTRAEAPPVAVPHVAPAPPAPSVAEEEPEDIALKQREEALRKRREEHAALMQKLEQEEEQARKAEEAYKQRRNQFLASKSSAVGTIPAASGLPVPSSPPAPAPSSPSSVPAEEPAEEAAPPASSASVPVADKSSTNPFSRLVKGGSGTPAATVNGNSSNPFFRPQPSTPAVPPPPKSPGIPPPVKTTYHTAPKDSDDDWDDVMEKEENDSSDEELGTRDTRMGLAQQLFGTLLPSRPQSAGPAPTAGSPTSPPAPAPPPPPPSALPALVVAPTPTGDRSALLGAIQGGARLKKTVTNDRSGAATSGKVVGDAAPPLHINAVVRAPSPPNFMASPSAEPSAASLMELSSSVAHGKRESVDWYHALAADADKREVDRLPVTLEEGEEEQTNAGALPSIEVSEHAADSGSELMGDIDLSTVIRVRSLYPYTGQREEDLDFDTNSIILAHPSKSGGDWWYGTRVKDSKVGFFPQTYVQKVEQVHATALYAYEGTNADELSLNEGDSIVVVDRSEADWWKAERDGFVFVVPAAYLEATEEDVSDIRNDVGRLDSEWGHPKESDTAVVGGDVRAQDRWRRRWQQRYPADVKSLHQGGAAVEAAGTDDDGYSTPFTSSLTSPHDSYGGGDNAPTEWQRPQRPEPTKETLNASTRTQTADALDSGGWYGRRSLDAVETGTGTSTRTGVAAGADSASIWKMGRAASGTGTGTGSMNGDEDDEDACYYSLDDEDVDDGDSADDGASLDALGDDELAERTVEGPARVLATAMAVQGPHGSVPPRSEGSDGGSETRQRGLGVAGLLSFAVAVDSDGEGTWGVWQRERERERGYYGHGHSAYGSRNISPAPQVMHSKSGSSWSSTGGPHSEQPTDAEGGGGIGTGPRRRRPAPPAPVSLRGSSNGLRRRPDELGQIHISTKDLPPIPTLDLPHTDLSSPGVLFLRFDAQNALGSEEDRDKNDEGGFLEAGRAKVQSDGSIVRPDDAFERYETFKKMQASQEHGHSPLLPHIHPTSASASRMSVSSLDTGSFAPTSPPKSPAASVTPSLRERERDRDGGTGGGGGTESRTSQFLSFLGRHTRASTPDIGERDRKLVISGPIVRVPTPSPISAPFAGSGAGAGVGVGREGPSRTDSPVFGSSWASLVDRSALEEIPKEERRRQEAIFELISTEADYVRNVQLIVELFYSRLIEVLDEKATATIFSNIEDILLTNTTFLSSLEERQRDCRLYIDRIGDLLEKHMPNMAVYLTYCVHQANAGKVLQQMRECNPALAMQLQNLREDPSARNLDLSSYLLVPMQRLTRYPLLIRQIMHYTDPSEGASTSWRDVAESESISTALQTAEKILEEVNETIREREGRERLSELSRTLWIGRGRLDLTGPTRHLGPRKLLKEGILNKARSGRKLLVLLCSDMLVLVDAAANGLYRMPILVNEIAIKPSRSGREDALLRLRWAYPRGGDAIVLRASNVREARAWHDAILDAGSKAREAVGKNVVQEPSDDV